MEYHNGQIVEGIITGIKPYGAFIQIDDTHNGLLHISEISDDYIKDINEFVKMREKISVKILDKGEDSHHYKLSLKALDKYPKRKRNYTQYYVLPKMEIGFKSIEDNLERWIKEAMEEKYD